MEGAKRRGGLRLWSARRLAEDSPGSVGESAGELAVLHQLANMTIEGRANCRKFGKADLPHARLDPMVGEARHAEQLRRSRLG